jgi:hypothetical protein
MNSSNQRLEAIVQFPGDAGNFPEEEMVGTFYAVGDTYRWTLLTSNTEKCIAEGHLIEGNAIPSGLDSNSMRIIPIPGGANTYYIKTFASDEHADGLFLYVNDFTEDYLSWVEEMPPFDGKNGGIWRLSLIENNTFYNLILDNPNAEEFLKVSSEGVEGGSAENPIQYVKVKEKDKKERTKKWIFVHAGDMRV